MAEIGPPHSMHPEVSRERRDVSIRALVMFFVALLISAALIHLLLTSIFDALTFRETAAHAPAGPLAEPERQPPLPRLQLNPPQDLRALRAAEDAVLHSYAWVDRAAGVVRIPIERAMELTLERGLPARPQQPETQPANAREPERSAR
jgi:hypothetical protein